MRRKLAGIAASAALAAFAAPTQQARASDTDWYCGLTVNYHYDEEPVERPFHSDMSRQGAHWDGQVQNLLTHHVEITGWHQLHQGHSYCGS
jgi:hypothetical protein